MGNSEVKDKKISVFEIITDRNVKGFERKVKKPVTKPERIWAYVRELTEKEKFAGKAAGVEQSALFKINYHAAIKAGQYIEMRCAYFRIVSVDKFEYYNRDLTIRAAECAMPEELNDKYSN